MALKLIFMGTPDFAVPSLTALDEARYEIVGVVTQPDRRKGRGKKMVPPPVKEVAITRKIPVFQPANPNTGEFIRQLKELSPDVIVTVAFGHLLKREILTLPPLGCLNLHASLLPKYRGAAPIIWAILNGEQVTGVTVMKMDEGMDTGPILAMHEEPITPDDTTETLGQKLAKTGASLLVETLEKWRNHEITPVPQSPDDVSYAPPLKKADGRIDWSQSAERIERKIRAMIPWPGAFTILNGKNLKIFKAKISISIGDLSPGESLVTDDTWTVASGNGSLDLLEVQMEGKKHQNIKTFLKGFKPRGRFVFT